MNQLQARELFHLEFLRRFSLKLAARHYALKDGVNMRFFFRSPRYSEDMDLDVADIGVDKLRDIVMLVLTMPSLADTLSSLGISAVSPPDTARAKQTETTQRFKIHLTVSGDVDVYTKIEFSRRGLAAGVAVEAITTALPRSYRLAPLIVPHYGAPAAFGQKIGALAHRRAPQARDIFDLYLLDTHLDPSDEPAMRIAAPVARKALDNLFSVEFAQFRDTVLVFLADEERRSFDDPVVWDEVRLAVSHRIERFL